MTRVTEAVRISVVTRSRTRQTADVAARAAGFASYGAYLASDAWRRSAPRLSALHFAAGRCRICSAGPGALECHHSSYDRLGDERFSDVIAICRACRAGVTAMLIERERHWERLVLRVADAERSEGGARQRSDCRSARSR